MPILGSCLCGGVQFEIDRAAGSSEICHCVRCQKKSGSTSLTMISARTSEYRLLKGANLIREYSAPILNQPPAYKAYFCENCGSAVPGLEPSQDFIEIPAGLFDNNPGVQPDKHIFVDFMPSWNVIRDNLPQFNLRQLIKHRFASELPPNYEATDHNGKVRKA
jgi:hypothetical protein